MEDNKKLKHLSFGSNIRKLIVSCFLTETSNENSICNNWFLADESYLDCSVINPNSYLENI